MKRIAVPALLCCLLSCSNDGAPSTGSCPGLPKLEFAALPSGALDSAQQMFLVSPKRFGDTESSLSNCLGVPLDVVVDTVTNIHTGEPDQVFHITYPGIRYSIYRVLADGKEILFKVEAFAPTEELALGIRVGVPWSHVLEELGAPTDEDPSTAVVVAAHYVVDQFVEETVTFWVEDGMVSRIRWDYYID